MRVLCKIYYSNPPFFFPSCGVVSLDWIELDWIGLDWNGMGWDGGVNG